MASVREIQVCGGKIVSTLEEACKEYLHCLEEGTDREKIHFWIALDSKEGSRAITFRQWGDAVEVYGDFDGLPNFLEWTKDKMSEEVKHG